MHLSRCRARRAQGHDLDTFGVPIGRLMHASFDLTDCARVVTAGAGHFEPGVAAPRFSSGRGRRYG
jgi:hypothetical protein